MNKEVVGSEPGAGHGALGRVLTAGKQDHRDAVLCDQFNPPHPKKPSISDKLGQVISTAAKSWHGPGIMMLWVPGPKEIEPR